MGYDVFISYSTQHNKKEADDICAALEKGNIKCWYAPRDIMAGKSYPGSIMYALNECSVMVLVYSSWSNQSQHIATEAERAFSRPQPLTIIPFRLDKSKPSADLEYCLSRSQWLDAFPEDKYSSALQSLVSAIQNTLLKNNKTPKAETSELSQQEQKLFKRIIVAFDDGVITDKEREQIESIAKVLEISKERLEALIDRAKSEKATPAFTVNELKYISSVKEDYVAKGKDIEEARFLADVLEIDPERVTVLEAFILGESRQEVAAPIEKTGEAPAPQGTAISPAATVDASGLLEYFQAKSPEFIEAVLYKKYDAALKEIEAEFDYYQNWNDSSIVLRVQLGKSKFNVCFRMLKSENTYAVWFDDVHSGKDASIEWLDRHFPGESAKKNVVNRRNTYGYVILWKKEILTGPMQEPNQKVFDEYCQFVLKTLDLFIPKLKEGQVALAVKLNFIKKTTLALSEIFPEGEGWSVEEVDALVNNTALSFYKKAWRKEGYSRGLLSFSLEAADAGFTNLCIGIMKGSYEDAIDPSKEEQLRIKVTEALQGYDHRNTGLWPYYSFVKDEYRYIEKALQDEDKFIAYIKEVFLLLKQSATASIDDIISTGSIGNPAVSLIDDTVKALSVAFPASEGWQIWQDASTLEKKGGISLYKTSWKNETVDRGEKALFSIRLESYKNGFTDLFIGIAKSPNIQIAADKGSLLLDKTREVMENVQDTEPDKWICWLNLAEPHLNIGYNLDKKDLFIPYVTDLFNKMAKSAPLIDSIVSGENFTITE